VISQEVVQNKNCTKDKDDDDNGNEDEEGFSVI